MNTMDEYRKKTPAEEAEIDELVEKKFEGSLPAFIAAFARSRKLSDREIDEVQRMIDQYRGRDDHD